MRQAHRQVPQAVVHLAAHLATVDPTGQVKTQTNTTNPLATGQNRSVHPTS